ncbi:hypothetical protein D3C76_1278050 [compost metagenome]
MVGQHDTTGTDSNGRGATGQVAQQYRGCRAGNAIHIVVLGHPEAVVAELFDVLCQVQRITQRLRWALILAYRDKVEGGNLDVRESFHKPVASPGQSVAQVECMKSMPHTLLAVIQ